MKATILLIDDISEDINSLSLQLKDIYEIKTAASSEEALEIAHNALPELILLNTTTPNISEFVICSEFKTDEYLCEIPIILIIEKKQIEYLCEYAETGASDYIVKPINAELLMCRVKTYIEFEKSISFLKNKNKYLNSLIECTTQELTDIQEVTVLAMASFAETRDYSTGKHVERTQLYVKELAKKLQKNPKYKKYLTDEYINLITKSAPLHDIGKVGIPDAILLKPGALTKEEFEIMKTHTELGLNTILSFESNIGKPGKFIQLAKEIVYSHHERWNGTGYPQGLKEDEIPISARLVSIADVYDALISDRVYKKAFPHEVAVRIIKDEAGEQFDPDVVEAFLSVENKFENISNTHKNS